MKKLRYLIIALVPIIIAACSDPKIDASSEDSMKDSVQQVRNALPESKRKEFDEAMQVIAFSQIDMKYLFTEGLSGVGNVKDKAYESLDGMTSKQIIAEAENILVERREKERKQALDEIHELVQKRVKAESARKQLKRFEVIRSRFYMREQKFMGKQPIIELTVKNGTDHAVSRAYFEATLASPNRSVPWHKDTFNHGIPGGLEPGEKANWSLAPNMFLGWGNIDAPMDAVLTVIVEQLDGPDGEPVYSTREFSEYDQKRLNELKKKYGVE